MPVSHEGFLSSLRHDAKTNADKTNSIMYNLYALKWVLLK